MAIELFTFFIKYFADNLFEFSYNKRKNTELFKDLETTVGISKIQNYIPIYKMFFSLNETNYKVSIEAGSTDCWKKFVGENGMCFGIDKFGKSAPYKDVYKYFGLTTERIVNKIKKMINNKA